MSSQTSERWDANKYLYPNNHGLSIDIRIYLMVVMVVVSTNIGRIGSGELYTSGFNIKEVKGQTTTCKDGGKEI